MCKGGKMLVDWLKHLNIMKKSCVVKKEDMNNGDTCRRL